MIEFSAASDRLTRRTLDRVVNRKVDVGNIVCRNRGQSTFLAGRRRLQLKTVTSFTDHRAAFVEISSLPLVRPGEGGAYGVLNRPIGKG